LVVVAVNDATPPAQIAPPPEILTVGVTLGETTIVTVLEVAVVGVTHEALEVITQVTTSLLANVVETNVAALVPALTPLTLH
jgi:hypothetical protein